MRSYDYTISIGHLGEQLTLNQWVLGSSPRWCTKEKPYGNVGLSFFVQSSGKQCLVRHRGREQHVRAVSVPPGSNSPVDCWKVRGSLRSLIGRKGGYIPVLPHQKRLAGKQGAFLMACAARTHFFVPCGAGSKKRTGSSRPCRQNKGTQPGK